MKIKFIENSNITKKNSAFHTEIGSENLEQKTEQLKNNEFHLFIIHQKVITYKGTIVKNINNRISGKNIIVICNEVYRLQYHNPFIILRNKLLEISWFIRAYFD